MKNRNSKWLVLAATIVVVLVSEMPGADAAFEKILRCELEGKWGDVKMTQDVTVIPSKDDQPLRLWALTLENEPVKLVDFDVRVGEISVDGDRYDLLLLQPGSEGSSLIGTYFIGSLAKPETIYVKVWKDSMPAKILGSEGTVYTGACEAE